jgi:DNA-directed RNA polymerase specialized sigma24 family protein
MNAAVQYGLDHREKAINRARALGVPAQEAEDVVQVTYLRLLRHDDSEITNARGYFFTMLDWEIIQHFRRQRHRRPLVPLTDELAGRIPAPTSTPRSLNGFGSSRRELEIVLDFMRGYHARTVRKHLYGKPLSVKESRAIERLRGLLGNEEQHDG